MFNDDETFKVHTFYGGSNVFHPKFTMISERKSLCKRLVYKLNVQSASQQTSNVNDFENSLNLVICRLKVLS